MQDSGLHSLHCPQLLEDSNARRVLMLGHLPVRGARSELPRLLKQPHKFISTYGVKLIDSTSYLIIKCLFI